jgi:hypothetical protein
MLLDRYRPELLPGLASAGGVPGIFACQSARKLSQADAGDFIDLLDRDLPPNVENREEFISRLHA